jgi:hypothetical protein
MVHVTDVGGVPGSHAYSVSVSCPVMTLSPSTLADGQVGQVYDESIIASGGVAPYTYAIVEGVLPAGLSLGNDGHLSGLATAAASRVITVEATDAFGCRARETWTLSVFADPAVSHVAASTAGLCLSAAHPTVTVPFRYTRGSHRRRVSRMSSSRSIRVSVSRPRGHRPTASTRGRGSGLTLSVRSRCSIWAAVSTASMPPCWARRAVPDSSGVLFTVDLAAARCRRCRRPHRARGGCA